MHGWSGQENLDRSFYAVSVTVISFGEESLKFMKRVFFNETYSGRCSSCRVIRVKPSPCCELLTFIPDADFNPPPYQGRSSSTLVVYSHLLQRLMTFNVLLEIGILSFSDCLSSAFSAVRFLDISRNIPIRAPLFFDGKFIRVSGNERVPASGLCPEKNNDVVRPPQHFFRSKLF